MKDWPQICRDRAPSLRKRGEEIIAISSAYKLLRNCLDEILKTPPGEIHG